MAFYRWFTFVTVLIVIYGFLPLVHVCYCIDSDLWLSTSGSCLLLYLVLKARHVFG